MAKLPRDCSGADAIRVFRRLGWTVARQESSHVTLIKPGSTVVLTVVHGILGPGLLRKLIRLAGVTVEDFIAAL